MTPVTKVSAVCGLIISVGTIVGGTYALYLGGIERAVAGEAQSREMGDLRTQIRVIELELRYLRAKQHRDADDELREETLRAQLRIFLERQAELHR